MVTATKRPELVRDIPASISVLTGQKLEDMGAHELKDFIQSVPGINSQDEIAGLQRKLSIRGVGPDSGTNQTVGIIYGDVALSDPYGSATIADPDPWDLKTVEVLKGPQGTLFGATSLAGIIRYVPNSPQLGSWDGLLSADWTHVDQGGSDPSFGVVLNAPIGDTVALRFAGSWQHKPGVVDIDNPSYKKVDADDGYTRTGRIMALWQPTEKFTLNAWYIKGQRKSGELGYLSNSDGVFVRKDTPGPSPVENGYSLGTLDARYTFDWATLVSISAYQTKNSYNDADTSDLVEPLALLGLRTVHSRRLVDTSGFQQELRLVSPSDGPWTWLAGAYLSTYTADITSTLNVYPGLAVLANLLNTLPLSAIASLYDPQQGFIATTTGLHPVKASEKALFGELSRTVGEDWKFTLGGRFYNAGVSGTATKSGAVAVLGNALSGGPSTQSVSSDGKGFSPKFSATWHYSDDIMAYGTVSRGFQYGGFNVGVLASVPPTYKSSTLWNYELGVRTDWLDRTLRFDLTGFYDPWKNPQVYQGTSNNLGGYTDNVGAALSTGAETTLSYITPIPGLTLETAASYIIANTTVAYKDSSGKVIESGTILPSSPKVQATTTISYGHDFGAWHTQSALMHTWQGAAWNDIEHDVQVGGYSMLNLNFAVSRNDLALSPSLSFQVNNLTNVDTLSSALGGADTIPGYPDLSHAITPRLYVFTQPRSFRINLTAKF
ncbi:MAG: TonB-dependent receptor [Stenotrophobium sp.]